MTTLIEHRIIVVGRDPKKLLISTPVPWGIKWFSQIYTIRKSTSTAK